MHKKRLRAIFAYLNFRKFFFIFFNFFLCYIVSYVSEVSPLSNCQPQSIFLKCHKYSISPSNYNAIKSNQIFHYTRWITPKRVTSWRGPSPRHCARATQLLSKKCHDGGEPLATLCPI